ncbi:MAG: efflux RND transporter periplasmic adaptor subunit [Pontiellaceae bacterium]|nr:efflux RND transporter periplasmic adaptor subunit [Pontiellaceae bacterium]
MKESKKMPELLKLHRNKILGGGAAVLIIVLAVVLLRPKGDQVPDDAPRAKVTRGDLVVSILQSGELVPRKSKDIVNEVSGNAKIVYIVEHGAEVTNGQLLVELESADLEERYLQQQQAVTTAEADLRLAEEELEITKLQHASDKQSAELKVELAEMALKKYVEAEYPQQENVANSDIKLAEQELEQARSELDGTQELYDKGYANLQDLRSAQFNVDRREITVENKKADLEILQKYTSIESGKELTNNVSSAKSELERLVKSYEAEMSRSDARISAQKTNLEIEKSQLETRERELGNTRIYADFEGQVFYPNTSNNRRQPQIETGASVDYRQKILSFPDLSAWNLKVGVPEALVEKVSKGQEALATVEASSGVVLKGRISQVSAVPDNQDFLSTGVKTYTIIIEVETTPSDKLKPGMSTKVEIVTDRLENVLQVPIQSVVSKGDEHYVYVINHKRKELRPVEIGKSNNQFVEVTSGLKEGEEILLYAEVEAEKDARLDKSPLEESNKSDASAPAGPATQPPAGRPSGGRPGAPNPSQMPAGFDPSQMPEGFDPSQMMPPGGFNGAPGGMPGAGRGRAGE